VLSGQATLVTSPALLAELARVLEAAAAGQADLIVTGDKAIRALGSFRGIPIVSASECMARLPRD
jgi:predicted nucleic acid-binding protein